MSIDRDTLYRRIHALPGLAHHGKGEQCFPITDAVLAEYARLVPAEDDRVSASAYSLALVQIEHDGEVIKRLTKALRVANHKPHDKDGPADSESGFPTCSECGAILTVPAEDEARAVVVPDLGDVHVHETPPPYGVPAEDECPVCGETGRHAPHLDLDPLIDAMAVPAEDEGNQTTARGNVNDNPASAARDKAVERALLYVFQLSGKDYRKFQTAMSGIAFVRALEQDGYTVVDGNSARAAEDEGRLREAARELVDAIDEGRPFTNKVLRVRAALAATPEPWTDPKG